MNNREVIMECVRIGAILRVTAVDVVTGTEINFQAPASASQSDLKKLAMSKLGYVLKKNDKSDFK
jgi:hypothetical protein